MITPDWPSRLGALGRHLAARGERLDAAISYTAMKNPWFIPKYVNQALQAIIESYLDEEKIRSWLSQYDQPMSGEPRRVGAVLAGNIPMVGIHDILCILASGHHAVVKPSDKDSTLLPFIFAELALLQPELELPLTWVDKLSDIEAVVATGSNQSSVYFRKYFGDYPHIIRKNRNAVAVLTGAETKAELVSLGHDIFDYFGLGCRNVSKLYVPSDYDFTLLLEAFSAHSDVIGHEKYKNNVDFNLATIIINRQPYLGNHSAVLIEETAIASKIGIIHYTYYRDQSHLSRELNDMSDQIQCIVGPDSIRDIDCIPFGSAQKPALDQYADGVDTMEFLLALHRS